MTQDTLTTDRSASGERSTCVAVVGMGNMGGRYLEVLGTMNGALPIAVSRRPARLQELAGQGRATAQTVQDAARKGATVCIVATDTGSHVADALAAIESGLAVLVEKPLAPDARQAGQLSERARQLGRRAFVACVLRFSQSLRAFRERLGELGPLHAVDIECQSYLPDWRPHRPYLETYSARAGDGGVLLDLIHEIDYAGWLFGWPAAVHARIKNLGRLGIAADEIAQLTWEAPTGCLVSVTLDYLSRPARRRVRACGARGTLEWDGIAQTVTSTRPGEPTGDVQAFPQTTAALFQAQIRAFLAACGGGSSSYLATSDEGCRALSVCDAARRASASHQEAHVEYR